VLRANSMMDRTRETADSIFAHPTWPFPLFTGERSRWRERPIDARKAGSAATHVGLRLRVQLPRVCPRT